MKHEFTREQLKRLANILDNAGQVFLATVVIAQLISGLENKNYLVIILGIIFTISCWWLSLRIERKIS